MCLCLLCCGLLCVVGERCSCVVGAVRCVLLFGVCCDCCLLCGVCCLLFVVFCAMSVVRCMLCVVCYLLCVGV